MLPPNVHRLDPDLWHGVPDDAPYGHSWRAPEMPVTQLGLNIAELAPGRGSCPLHHHHFEEEIFVVLQGELVVRELEPGAERYREFPLRQGELVAYPAGTGLAHQFFNRSQAPARYLSLSDQIAGEVCEYPDSGKVALVALGGPGVFGEPPDTDFTDRPRRRPVDVVPTPPHVCAPGAERDLGGPFGQQLSRPAGAQTVFVNRDRLPPGTWSGPLHAHTADDELLLVLEGSPTLVQRRGDDWSFTDSLEERCALQPGDVVHWAAGDRVAHRLGNEAADDAVVLVIGTDRAKDLCVFPETGRVHVRALGRTGRFLRTDYWAGE